VIPLADVHDDLGDALAQFATALQLPVLLLAIAALLACALELGRFATELWRRRAARDRGDGGLRRLALHAVQRPAAAAQLAEQAPTAFAATALRQICASLAAGRQLGVEHALADYELAAQRRLDRTRMLVRAGPALGLMGTLIPLAPGLAALERGDVAGLAADLRIAFAATVVGLLVGTVAFALTLTRTRLYTEDLTALERAVAVAQATPPADGAAPVPASAATQPAGAAADPPVPAP
jgi:biopolymer transport protein ExbB/TolQ